MLHLLCNIKIKVKVRIVGQSRSKVKITQLDILCKFLSMCMCV